MEQFESYHLVRDELGPDEELIWTGVPKRGLRLTPADGFMIPFSLLWGGFAVFWEVMAITMDAPIIMPIFGLPFVVIGLYLIFGRFFHDAWVRARTTYVITSKRLLIIQSGNTKKVNSFDLNSIEGVELSTKADGSGSISTGGAPSLANVQLPIQRGKPGGAFPGFDLIENARDVYHKILEAKEGMEYF